MWGLLALVSGPLLNVGAAERCFGEDQWNGVDKFVLAGADDHAHLQLSATYPDSPNYWVTWRVYATLDDTSERWDTVPVLTGRIPRGAPGRVSVPVSGIYKFKVCVAGDPAGVMTTPEVDLEYRKTAPPAP